MRMGCLLKKNECTLLRKKIGPREPSEINTRKKGKKCNYEHILLVATIKTLLKNDKGP